MGDMRKVNIIISVLLALSIGSDVYAGQVTCDALQYRLDRLYFAVGEEAFVYPHARYSLLQGEDTIHVGSIEHSWQGVAISEPLGMADSVSFDLTDLGALFAIIQTADLDTVSAITVGSDIVGLPLISRGNDSVRLIFREYDHHQTMLHDFQDGLLDACLSFGDLQATAKTTVISHPAPWVAALVPNIGRRFNQGGQLTTSLYYRYDETKLDFCFEGDVAGSTHRFHIYEPASNGTPAHRQYSYDPARGRVLFQSMSIVPDSLALFSGSPALDQLTFYFADIISRDRCPVKLTQSRREADVYLEFVPVSSELPSVTMYTLYHRLVQDSMADMRANEYIRRIATAFRFVESPSMQSDYYRNLDAAERIMIEDLGVFPLFRPVAHLSTHQNLQGLEFDSDGRLDTSMMMKLILPDPPAEATP